MDVADGDHSPEDLLPSLRRQHHFVGEHAAVPTDVLDCFRELAGVIA